MNITETMQYLVTVARLNCAEVEFSHSSPFQFRIEYNLSTLGKIKKEIDKINLKYPDCYKLIAAIYCNHIVITVSSINYNSVKLIIE